MTDTVDTIAVVLMCPLAQEMSTIVFGTGGTSLHKWGQNSRRATVRHGNESDDSFVEVGVGS
jgi:hypothetical protein